MTGRALVPGCGRGYAVEALQLARARRPGAGGERDRETRGRGVPGVVEKARDFEAREDRAGRFLGARAGATWSDLAFDSTFLCAIEPSRRKEWASKYASLIRPGGELVSNVFPNGDFEGGPPFALSPKIVADLLVPVGFESGS